MKTMQHRVISVVVGGLMVTGSLVGHAVNVQWNGSTNTAWATGANWTGNAGNPPADNTTSDTAQFIGALTGNQPSVDTARSVAGVYFSSAGWTISGTGSLTVGTQGGRDSAGIYDNTTGTNTISCNVTPPNNDSNILVQNNGTLILSGVVSGQLSPHWDTHGTIRLAGSSSNNITSFTARGGIVELAKTGGAKALNMAAGEFSSSGGTIRWLEDNQFANVMTDKNTSGLTMDLNGHTDTFGRVYGNGNLAITLGGGTFNFAGDSTYPVIWNHWDGVPTATMTVTGPGSINLTTSGDFNPGHITAVNPSGIDLDISATITAGAGVANVSVGAKQTPYNSVWGVTRFSAPAGNSYAKNTNVTNSATLVVSNTSGSATGTGNVYVTNASATALKATLAGTGIIIPGAGNKLYVQNKGVLSPGFGSTDAQKKGTLTVTGDVTFQAGSAFNVDFGAGTSDTLAVSGLLDLGGTTLNLTQVGTPSYYPPFTIYTLATYGTLAGSFGTITGLPAGAVMAYDGGSIRLTVPEPAALALFAVGALGVLGRRRRA